MFKTNEYFDGKVKSIAFQSDEGTATAGVMAQGEYEFGTSSVEFMTVTSGSLSVMLPEQNSWTTYKKGETFRIEKDIKFKVKAQPDSSYICIYK